MRRALTIAVLSIGAACASPAWLPSAPARAQEPPAPSEQEPPGEAAPAGADVPGFLSIPFSERPLTLPAGRVRADGVFAITSTDEIFPERETFVSFLGGFAWGIVDWLEVGATLLPLTIAPEARFEDPGFHALARATDGPLELGFQLEVTIPVRGESGFGILPAVRLLWHVSSLVRIDAAAAFGLRFADPVDSQLRVPITVTFQPTSSLFLGVQSGFDVVQFHRSVDDGRDVFLSAGVFFGGTLHHDRGASADLRVGIYLPNVTGGFGTFQIGLGGAFFP